MDIRDIKKGDKVYFGRGHGEQTLGEVVKVNRVKCKVKQLEARGTYKAYPVGTIWTVPVSLLSKAATPGAARAEIQSNRRPASPPPPTEKRPEEVVMQDILRCYGMLSPENLSCDGELSMTAVRRRASNLRGRLRTLFAELGRTVNEDEAYRWEDARRLEL